MESNIFSMKNIKTIAFFAVVIMILSLVLSFIQPPKYQSSAKLLVVTSQESIDSYAASYTADYVATVLSEVIYSNSFIDNVYKTRFSLNDDLGFTQEKKQKNWKKMVRVRTKEGRGIIFIDVLHKDRDQADQFAQAIVHALITKHDLYHGLGDQIAIKVIDNPVSMIS